MDTNKFEALLNRFEGHVQNVENDKKQDKSAAGLLSRFEGLIGRLEHTYGKGGAPAQV